MKDELAVKEGSKGFHAPSEAYGKIKRSYADVQNAMGSRMRSAYE